MRHLSYSQLSTVTRGITVPGKGGSVYAVERAFLQQYAGGSVGRSSHTSRPIRDFISLIQPPIQTTLQQYLGNGEYPLFQSVAMFESSFIQVTRKGKQVYIHNHSNQAIVGIATTNTNLPLPNIMFVARPAVGRVSSGQYPEELMLTRLIPLKFVRISIHDTKKQLIKIKLINRRSYYLQLYSPAEDGKALFDCWLSLIYLLHHPPRCYLQSCPKSPTTIDNLSVQVVPSEIETKVDQDESWEDEMDSLPLEKKETKAKFQSQDTIQGETFSKSEDYVLRMRSRLLTSSRRSLANQLESFESYKASLPTSAEASRKYSMFPSLLSEESDVTLSRCSMPPTQIPEQGESSSVNIVTIFSIVSNQEVSATADSG